VVLGAVRAAFHEIYLEWRPYFYYWLDSPGSEEAERAAVDAGEIPGLGFRWVGTRGIVCNPIPVAERSS
jgi:hypothetical protein